MSNPTRGLSGMELFYIALGLVGLAGTAVQVPAYLALGPVAGTAAFWQETLATPASTFLVVDILVLVAAALIWMFSECRRLGIAQGWAWVYFLVSTFVGVSFAFPLFMAHRERRLRSGQPEQRTQLAGADYLGAALLLLAVAAAVLYSILHLPA